MRYPSLVPECVCITPCDVVIYSDDLDTNGAPKAVFSGSLKCNYQERSARTLTDKEMIIVKTGKAYFHGDPFPDIPISSGELTVYGAVHKIKNGTKARNLDGSVNYTMLEVV